MVVRQDNTWFRKAGTVILIVPRSERHLSSWSLFAYCALWAFLYPETGPVRMSTDEYANHLPKMFRGAAEQRSADFQVLGTVNSTRSNFEPIASFFDRIELR